MRGRAFCTGMNERDGEKDFGIYEVQGEERLSWTHNVLRTPYIDLLEHSRSPSELLVHVRHIQRNQWSDISKAQLACFQVSEAL